ncbi:hypothetical protein NPIL_42611 [Nephila pilipes]|uniref:Uncharacterized protein n=1 Tax=Nephila pilipes TaxID=299642 RepID=A0A8X6MWT9_NEPPI|nr:hypothetical protein NPIL_42611 [Nephila pilipes]
MQFWSLSGSETNLIFKEVNSDLRSRLCCPWRAVVFPPLIWAGSKVCKTTTIWHSFSYFHHGGLCYHRQSSSVHSCPASWSLYEMVELCSDKTMGHVPVPGQ